MSTLGVGLKSTQKLVSYSPGTHIALLRWAVIVVERIPRWGMSTTSLREHTEHLPALGKLEKRKEVSTGVRV